MGIIDPQEELGAQAVFAGHVKESFPESLSGRIGRLSEPTRKRGMVAAERADAVKDRLYQVRTGTHEWASVAGLLCNTGCFQGTPIEGKQGWLVDTYNP
jgi:hypothetical protein